MQGTGRFNLPKSDGFTLVEVLVALAVFALAGLGVWTALSGFSRHLSRVAHLSRASSQILRLDNALRSELGRIRFPFWLGIPPVIDEGEPLELPYRQGVLEDLVRVEFRERMVTVSRTVAGASEEVGRFGPFESAVWQIAPPEDRQAWTLWFTIMPAARKRAGPTRDSYQLYVALGSHPIFQGVKR